MRLNSTRADNNSAQIVKGHASVNMGGNTPSYVYIYASATGAPSASAPNGNVTMNMAALAAANNTKVMRGKISADSTGLQFAMNQSAGGNSQNIRLYVSGSDGSGSGAISYPDPVNPGTTHSLTFGYNATAFCRKENGTTTCFDRNKSNANFSVWRYGVYDDTTGARYDLATPGFPIKNANTGEYGFASYWGIWLPTAVTNGASLVSADSAQTAYTVMKTGGRLSKVSLVSSTLDGVTKVPFNFMPQTSTSVTNGTMSPGTNYEAYWDGTNFIVTGQVSCGQTGCFKTNLSPTWSATPAQINASVTVGPFSMGINGWSQGLGGNLMIPATTLSNASPGGQPVKYNVQTVVMPGDSVPATLKCARDCTSYNLLAANTINDVATTGTKQKGGGTAANAVVTYTWNSNNYTLSDSAGVISNSLLTGKTLPTQFMNGFRTGALVDATGTNWSSGGAMDCSNNGTNFCDFKANNLPVYYVWENGTQDFQSATFLKKSDGTVVQFTPPQGASFDVPNDAKLNLQFMGFGNLGGIPGRCFDPQTNQPADCGPSTRYVPAIAIPENTATSALGKLTFTISGSNVTKWIKFLDREIRFKRLGVDGQNGYNMPGDITLGDITKIPAALALSGADSEDPSNSANSNYSGVIQSSDFLAAPSVIHGIVQ
jgi:hypothetical protein